MTEQPIPDVDVELSKTTTIPGPGSPGLLSHKTELQKSDDRGEFVAPEHARISLRKKGYLQRIVAQTIHSNRAPWTLYLTKNEDSKIAEYEYRLEAVRWPLSHPLSQPSAISYYLSEVLRDLPSPASKKEIEQKDKLCMQVVSMVEQLIARTPDPCQKCESARKEILDFTEKCAANG